MKRTIRELRLARGLSQQELALRVEISQSQLSRIESLEKGAPADLLARLCRELECLPQDVLVADSRKSGGQVKVAREELSLLRLPPAPIERPHWTSACRLEKLRREYPKFMRQMEAVVARWPTTISTAELGFDLWPVCDEDGRGAATRLRPALVTREWVMLFQVWVVARGRWRMDCLVLVREPQPAFINVEVDGNGHNPSEDERRTRALGMPTLRIPGHELLKGPSLTERLRAMGFCLPRR